MTYFRISHSHGMVWQFVECRSTISNWFPPFQNTVHLLELVSCARRVQQPYSCVFPRSLPPLLLLLLLSQPLFDDQVQYEVVVLPIVGTERHQCDVKICQTHTYFGNLIVSFQITTESLLHHPRGLSGGHRSSRKLLDHGRHFGCAVVVVESARHLAL